MFVPWEGLHTEDGRIRGEVGMGTPPQGQGRCSRSHPCQKCRSATVTIQPLAGTKAQNPPRATGTRTWSTSFAERCPAIQMPLLGVTGQYRPQYPAHRPLRNKASKTGRRGLHLRVGGQGIWHGALGPDPKKITRGVQPRVHRR